MKSPNPIATTIALFMLGFSAGMPILLIFSTLSVWLLEAGAKRDMVTLFSFAALAYSFKFLWSPLIDSLTLPVLTRTLGKRRSWLLLAQVLIMVAIVLMAMSNPTPANSQSLLLMAVGAVLLGFSSATQDVVIDAYRIEIIPNNPAIQSTLSASYTAGYRLGMVVAGAGSLLLAGHLGSDKTHYVYDAWRNTYFCMAGIMGVGVMTTLLIREPEPILGQQTRLSAMDNLRLLAMFVLAIVAFIFAYREVAFRLPEKTASPLLQFAGETVQLGVALTVAAVVAWLCVSVGLVNKQIVWQTWVEPLTDFFKRYGKRAIALLLLIGLYRISDIVSGVISNVFYTEMGFSKEEIAWAVKTFGVIMSIFGGFIGGLLAQKYRIMNMMMFGAIAAALTNLLFILLANRGHDVSLMYTVVGLDNFAAGLAGTVFVAFLSALTNIRFTAVQYALFSSLMTLIPKVLGGYSGSIVNQIEYTGFYAFTAALSIPILLLIWWVDKFIFREQK